METYYSSKKFYNKIETLSSKLNDGINHILKTKSKGLISLVGAGLMAGEIVGCDTVQTNTIKINPGTYQSTLKNYSTDEIKINGKYYLGLRLPKNKTGEITGEKGNKLIPNRNLLLDYYLIPFSDSETIRKKGKVSIKSKNTYVLVNPDYCVPNHNLILPEKSKTKATERELIFYSYSRNINETQREEKGSHIFKRETKTLDEEIPEVILGNGKNEKTLLYIKQKKETRSNYNIHPNTINGNNPSLPKNVKRLPVVFFDNNSEFYTITRRNDEKQVTEERIRGKTYVPIRAKIININNKPLPPIHAEFVK